jgi:hypothetical protein
VIRITRTAEPPALAAVRQRKLAAAREASRRGAERALDGYEVVKHDLYAMQHYKCCYCEKREEQPKYRDVEHYRPKSRYWWLAWTWENLFFACNDCNREHKRDQFPLEVGGAPLVAEQSPPGEEQPLLLDPTDRAVEPTTEIVFRRSVVAGRERWAPYGTTPRGRRTIEVCGLDRPGLLTLYASHVNGQVRPRLEIFLGAARSNDARDVVPAWGRLQRSLLARGQPFRALSFGALCALVPASLRECHRLTLEPPAPLHRHVRAAVAHRRGSDGAAPPGRERSDRAPAACERQPLKVRHVAVEVEVERPLRRVGLVRALGRVPLGSVVDAGRQRFALRHAPARGRALPPGELCQGFGRESLG